MAGGQEHGRAAWLVLRSMGGQHGWCSGIGLGSIRFDSTDCPPTHSFFLSLKVGRDCVVSPWP